MNRKTMLSLALTVLVSVTACQKDPLRVEPKPDPAPTQPTEDNTSKEDKKDSDGEGKKDDENEDKPNNDNNSEHQNGEGPEGGNGDNPSGNSDNPEDDNKEDTTPGSSTPTDPTPKAFTAGDFMPDMLSNGVLTLPKHFVSISSSALDAQKSEITKIIAPGVTEIEERAFSGYTSLRAIEMPLLTKIGNKAFEQCHNLSKVEQPTLIEVGDEAFAHCLNLAEVDMPKVAKIGRKAFAYLYRLRKVTLGDQLPSVADDAFYYSSTAKVLVVPNSAISSYSNMATNAYFLNINGNTNLVSGQYSQIPETLLLEGDTLSDNEDSDEEEVEVSNFVLKSSVKTISENAFNSLTTSDRNILMGYFRAPGVQKIESGAFRDQDKLEFVEFPNATSVASGAFAGCKKLSVVIMPQLTHIQSTTFEHTGLKYIDLSSATRIDENAFQGCSSLEYIILGNDVPQTPELIDPNDPLNRSIFGRTRGASPVKTGQVTIVVPDASLSKYNAWKTKFEQIKAIIPVSKFIQP
ncbi:MAG: leucine-rich repeat protein [Porphyromonadaceae bacterium]|nr:leucine-rich repeat protein [Porphyromonadaceae bacterium]